MIVHQIFPTVVMEFDLNSKVNSQLLYNELRQMEIKDHPLLSKNAGSSYDPGKEHLLDLKIPLIKKLKDSIQESLDVYTNEVGLLPCQISNSWMSIMNANSYLHAHRHEASVLSGAYYPHSSADAVGLTFVSPLMPYMMCEVNEKITGYNAKEGTLQAKEGVLYLFPSWLEHRTDVNTVDNRMVISFNTLNTQPGK